MRNVSLITSFAIATASLAVTAAADPVFEYGYIQAELHSNTFDDYKGEGHGVSAAFEIGDRYFLSLGYSGDDADDSLTDYVEDLIVAGDSLTATFDIGVERTRLQLGFGAAWAISESTDFVGEIFYLDDEFETSLSGTYAYRSPSYNESGSICDLDPAACAGETLDDSGFGLSLGLRGQVTDSFELYGTARYIDLDIYDTAETYYEVDLGKSTMELGMRFTIAPRFLLGLAYVQQGDFESIQGSVRFPFNSR